MSFLARSKTKALQKMGKSDKTVDTEFETHKATFRELDTLIGECIAAFDVYNAAWKTMMAANEKMFPVLARCFAGTAFAPAAAKYRMAGETVNAQAASLMQTMETSCKADMVAFHTSFGPFKDRINLRRKLCLDMDNARDAASSLQNKAGADPAKLQQAQDRRDATAAEYERANDALKADLSEFLTNRGTQLVPIIRTVVEEQERCQRALVDALSAVISDPCFATSSGTGDAVTSPDNFEHVASGASALQSMVDGGRVEKPTSGPQTNAVSAGRPAGGGGGGGNAPPPPPPSTPARNTSPAPSGGGSSLPPPPPPAPGGSLPPPPAAKNTPLPPPPAAAADPDPAPAPAEAAGGGGAEEGNPEAEIDYLYELRERIAALLNAAETDEDYEYWTQWLTGMDEVIEVCCSDACTEDDWAYMHEYVESLEPVLAES